MKSCYDNMHSEIKAAVVSPKGNDSSSSVSPEVTDSKKDKIKVVVRLRPLTEKLQKSIVQIDNQSVLLDEKSIHINDGNISDVKRTKVFDDWYFTFDAVFSENASQEEVYQSTAMSLVRDVISGYNGMIFAYGATGSGKTHTMMAICHDNQDKIDYSHSGIVLQAFRDIFSIIETQQDNYIITMSFMEIHNENIKDLLNPDSGYLDLRGNTNIQIVGLSEFVVTSTEQAVNFLKKGNEIRSVRYTCANSVSSRSHAILIIVLRQSANKTDLPDFKSGTRQSKLLFVDLAGSERAKHTKNKGARLQEGGHINKSLLALGNCISALSSGTKAFHVNFRDSKLTRILREPLSGNYRTVMVAQINPIVDYREEIKNTLIFATKAKGVTKRIKQNSIDVLNVTPNRYQNLISELRDEVSRLKDKIKIQEKSNKPLGKNNHPAMALRNQIISAFEERMKLRRDLLNLDNQILLLTSEAENQQQIISYWQSKNNKMYGWKNSTVHVTDDKEAVSDSIDRATRVLDSIEKEMEILVRQKNSLVEKLEELKEMAMALENELIINSNEDTEKELFKLFCKVHELEADKLSLQGERMAEIYELRRCSDLINRYQEQQMITDNIITKQIQIIGAKKIEIPMDLKKLYKLYQEEIHLTTMRNLKNNVAYGRGFAINLPPLNSRLILSSINENENGSLSHRERKFADQIESENGLLKCVPKVQDGICSYDNERSRNPSPIPAAVIFPPITI